MYVSLEKRLTRTYVGTYQHEDKWEQIGTVDEIGSRALPMSEEDEQDPCEPQSREVFCLVKLIEGHDYFNDFLDDEEAAKTIVDDKNAFDKWLERQIKQSLSDTYTMAGCACEHDCCGCRSYYASYDKIERVTGDLWKVVISSSRNY